MSWARTFRSAPRESTRYRRSNKLPARNAAIAQPLVHHAEKPLDLFRIALDRVGNFFRRVAAEVVALSRHRAEAAHLPEQPLVDVSLRTFARRIERAEFSAEILEDGARFEDARGGCPSGPSGSTIAGIRLFGEIARNSGANCSPLPISMNSTR